MADKCKEDYKEQCKRNGLNYDLKVEQRERQHKARMKSSMCPNCDKEMRLGSLKSHQPLHCKAKLMDAFFYIKVL